MARQARYEDTVCFDADPVEELGDGLRDPNSGRLYSELAAERREASRVATVEKAVLFMAVAA